MNEKLLEQLRDNTISGADFARENSRLMDTHLRALIDLPDNTALIATGGYGREELCPASDIDILFLTEGKADHAAIEAFLYKIWDSSIKIGHAVRSIKDCVRISGEDVKAATTLLDARLIAGNVALFEGLQAKLAKKRAGKGFQKNYRKAKLAEQAARHARFEDSRYVLEPNIKDGKGALRDYQTLIWLGRVMETLPCLSKKERQRFEKAHDFLLTVRCHLHDIARRAEERLHFDIQPRLAKRLGYSHRDNAKAVERFMKHYFLQIREIGVASRIVLEDQETNLVPALFRDASKAKALRDNPTANAQFLEILTAPQNAALTLRRMHETGVLARFIPEFARITALMQFDRYHVFTVDEHTLRAIDILHQIENGAVKDQAPLATALFQTITNRRALYVAMFLHDICKGRKGDHSQLGAELALKLCPRLGLSDDETRLVSWLIYDHLLMAETAFRRDLEDPKTNDDFVFRIHDIERLKLLTILTTADIMAVGPERWTDWKASLIEELYTLATAQIEGETSDRTITAPTPPKDLQPGETRIDIAQDAGKNATTITVITQDRPALFATLTGALATAGVNIIEARIHTHDTTAMDTFTVQNTSGQPITKVHRHDTIQKTIRNALDENLTPSKIIENQKNRDLVFDVPSGITIDTKASRDATVIEIYTRDRPALLHDIAQIMNTRALNIKSAKINTAGLKAIDIFYIQNQDHEKITDPAFLDMLCEDLNVILN